ncbi:hypothetical protein D3C87_1855810 [compost metagenome]
MIAAWTSLAFFSAPLSLRTHERSGVSPWTTVSPISVADMPLLIRVESASRSGASSASRASTAAKIVWQVRGEGRT